MGILTTEIKEIYKENEARLCCHPFARMYAKPVTQGTTTALGDDHLVFADIIHPER
jgi:hypothetical protein